MPLKRVRPPRSIQGSSERDHAAWERQVQHQVGDTELTLGEVENLLFLDRNYSYKANDLQSQIDVLKVSFGLFKKMSSEIEELKRQIDILKVSDVVKGNTSSELEEIKRRLNEQENTTWLLPLN